MGRNVPKRWAQGDLSAAQDEAADAQTEAIVARVSATVAAALRAELVELRSWSQEVPELVARTEKLEQFVEGLKPDGKDPVVRRDEHNFALGVMETTQTLAEELKARVDELAALKAQVDSVVARVPDDRQSPWIQGLSSELEQRVQEDVKRRLDATLKEYRRDSSTTHQQNQLDGVSDRMDKIDGRIDEHLRRLDNFGAESSRVRFELDTLLSEREAKLEGSPMPRMARGAARGGTGSARGRRGDRRLTFEEEQAPDETPEGAEYRRGSGGRPSMFRFDQETEERAEEEL